MWIKGRQKSGYDKLKIYSFSFFGKGFDCYILRFKTGSYIKPHIDNVHDKKHYRLNIILNRSYSGGLFTLDGVQQKGRTHRFRPDIQEHSVSKILSGTRYVLSFGKAT